MIVRKIVIRFCNNIRHFSNEINKRGGGIFFLRRVEFFKIGKLGLHVYYLTCSRTFQIEVFCGFLLINFSHSDVTLTPHDD